jgi:multicomponent Na+:H+ antiporter subunit D
VINQLQLLLLASLAFTVLIRTGLYPPELRSVNLDADALYRRALPAGWRALTHGASRARRWGPPVRRRAEHLWTVATSPLRPTGRVAVPWATDLMVWWGVLLLGLVLLLTLW